MKFLVKETHAKRSKINLNLRDKKLIQLLIQDGRISASSLAKKLKISKPAVTQKIKSLQKKGIILNAVTYINPSLKENSNLYMFEIKTNLGIENQKITSEILSIDEISALLWFNGEYNLLISSTHPDPQETLTKLKKIITIKKIKIRKATKQWFHPPHLFKEISDKKPTSKEKTKEKTKPLDDKILSSLEQNPRASLIEIATSTKSTAQTIKKRLKFLKESGAIIAFTTLVNVWLCDREIVSVNFSINGREETKKIISTLLTLPQTSNVWEFDHEWNLNAVFWVKEQIEINTILNNLQKRCGGILDTEIAVLTGMAGK